LEKKIIIFVLLFCTITLPLKSQIINFPVDSARFVLMDQLDSVFIFTEEIGGTATGEHLSRLHYIDGSIAGDPIPPALKIRNPIGAIIYSAAFPFKEIPIIDGRQNRKLPLDKLLRDYLLCLNSYQGQSEKGGITFDVWHKEPRQVPFLIFYNNNRTMGNANQNDRDLLSKSRSSFDARQLLHHLNEIVGVWLYPPDIGNDHLVSEMLKLMQQGPTLVEYWDGLGWQLLERCYLSDKIKGLIDWAELGYALFPPVTEVNYRAMISGGLYDLQGKRHLFDCLDSLGVSYQILEGEKMIIPVQGNVQLHTGETPEKKDEKVYQSALSVIKKSPPVLLFLHYHGMDDLAHTHGPYSARTTDHVRRLWQWHQELRRQWSGNLLVISDHGAHEILPQQNRRKDKGTHGDFIFEDMAVPLIYDKGKGTASPDFRLSTQQAHQAWDLLGTAKSTGEIFQKAKPGNLEIIRQGVSKLFSATDEQLFRNDFHFQFTRKGVAVSGKLLGAELLALIDNREISSINRIIAYSYDGHQSIFSKEDLRDNQLVIALDRTAESAEMIFSLYPLKDQFPNRVVKQLQKIVIF